jgi:hypothetical protein
MQQMTGASTCKTPYHLPDLTLSLPEFSVLFDCKTLSIYTSAAVISTNNKSTKFPFLVFSPAEVKRTSSRWAIRWQQLLGAYRHGYVNDTD